jgi:hypothetical protein
MLSRSPIFEVIEMWNSNGRNNDTSKQSF